MLGSDCAAGHNTKAIDQNGLAPPRRLGLAHHGTLDHLRATANVIGGVKVITHQGADTGLQITWVAQGFGNRVLAFEGKLLRRTGHLKMELTPQAQ